MTGEDNHEQKPSILGKITEGYHEGKRDAEEDVRARAGKDNHEQKPSILDKITEGYHEGKHKAEEDERARAAAKIQKVWREKKGRAQADYLSSELRWRVRLDISISKIASNKSFRMRQYARVQRYKKKGSSQVDTALLNQLLTDTSNECRCREEFG